MIVRIVLIITIAAIIVVTPLLQEFPSLQVSGIRSQRLPRGDAKSVDVWNLTELRFVLVGVRVWGLGFRVGFRGYCNLGVLQCRNVGAYCKDVGER